MRYPMIGLLAPMVLAGCLGGGNNDRSASVAPAPLVSHDAFVASLNGAFIWDCTMTSNTGQAWQFVLAEGASSQWNPVVFKEAGARFDEDVETRSFGAAVIYQFRNTSDVLIADDGEARGKGPPTTKPSRFPQGQCTRGTQPTNPA